MAFLLDIAPFYPIISLHVLMRGIVARGLAEVEAIVEVDGKGMAEGITLSCCSSKDRGKINHSSRVNWFIKRPASM